MATAAYSQTVVTGGQAGSPLDITRYIQSNTSLTFNGGSFIVKIPGSLSATGVAPASTAFPLAPYVTANTPTLTYTGTITGSGALEISCDNPANCTSNPPISYGSKNYALFNGGMIVFGNALTFSAQPVPYTEAGKHTSSIIIDPNIAVAFEFGSTFSPNTQTPNGSKNFLNNGYLYLDAGLQLQDIVGSGYTYTRHDSPHPSEYLGVDLDSNYNGTFLFGGGEWVLVGGNNNYSGAKIENLDIYNIAPAQRGPLYPNYLQARAANTVPTIGVSSADFWDDAIDTQFQYHSPVMAFTGHYFTCGGGDWQVKDPLPAAEAIQFSYMYTGVCRGFNRQLYNVGTIQMGNGEPIVTNPDGTTNIFIQGSPHNTYMLMGGFESAPGNLTAIANDQEFISNYSGTYTYNAGMSTTYSNGQFTTLGPAYGAFIIADPGAGKPANHLIETSPVLIDGITWIQSNAILQLGDGTTGNDYSGTITVGGKSFTGQFNTSNGNGAIVLDGNLPPDGFAVDQLAVVGGSQLFNIIDDGALIVENTIGALDIVEGDEDMAAFLTANELDSISGPGSLEQRGNLPLTLLENITYTGSTTVGAGTLILGTNRNGLVSSIASSSSLNLTGSTALFDIASASNETVQNLSGVAGSRVGLGSYNLTVVSGSNTTFSGAIEGAGGLAKQGSAQLVLNGISTYTGATQITSGTLVVGDASTPDAIIAGSASVATGGTLAGTGTVGGSVTNSGTVSPGASTAGALSVGGSYSSISTSALDIAVAPGSGTQLSVTGAATCAGSLVVNFASGTYTDRVYTLLSASSVSGTFSSVSLTGSVPTNLNPVVSYTSSGVFLTLSSGASLPTVTLSALPTTVLVGNSITLSGAVAPPKGSTAFATGSLTFYDGTTALSTVSLNASGQATFAASLAAGSHILTASYSGSYHAATSSSVTVEVTAVEPVTPQISLKLSASEVYINAPVTVTATVTPLSSSTVAPTGLVVFSDGQQIGSQSLDATGTATFTWSTNQPGRYSAVASYLGDTNYQPVSSSAVSLQVDALLIPTVKSTASPNPIPYTSKADYSFIVSPPAGSTVVPTGTITFGQSNYFSDTLTLDSNGDADTSPFTWSPGVGVVQMYANYSGDGIYAPVSTGFLLVKLAQLPLTTTVLSAPSTAATGTPFTLSAAVSPANASSTLPTGTVQFDIDGLKAGTSTMDANGLATFSATIPTDGVHIITAAYSGDANFSPSLANSATVDVTGVTPILPGVLLSSTSYLPAVGTGVTLTATMVTPSGLTTPTPTGTIKFNESGYGTLTNVTLNSSGVATYSKTFAAGIHSITALYSGDLYNQPAVSSAIQITVTNPKLIQPVITASTSATTIAQATPLQISVQVAAPSGGTATPTGTVEFLDGSTLLNTETLDSNGNAVLTVTNLTPGTHSITVSYSGDGVYSADNSSVVNVTVTGSLTVPSVTLSAEPLSAPFGTNVSLIGKIIAPKSATTHPTGTVTFMDGSTVLSVEAVSSSTQTAAFNSNTLTVGTHMIKAVYSGDANYTAATSAVVVVTVTSASSTVGLQASGTAISAGTNDTFTATLAPATATGQVTFKDGTTTLGTGVLSSDVATFSTSTLTAGTHSITAVYGGDSNNTAATSAVVVVTVTATTSTVALQATSSAISAGANDTFTATLSPATATGSVTFNDGTTALGTGVVSSGVATFSTASLRVGTHSIVAVYSGDADNAAATSAVVVVTVTAATSTVALQVTSASIGVGLNDTFTVTLSPATATGQVTIKDGTTTLGTVTLATGGTATFSTSSLTVGTHSITAVYGGDTNDAAATSAAIIVTVTAASSGVSLQASAATLQVGAAETFTATLSPTTATGTIIFYDGTTALGSATLSGGVAKLSTTVLTVGSHSITASYGGDSNNGASVSQIVSVTVTVASSGVSLQASAATLQLGAAETFTATLSPSTATGTVTFMDGSTSLGAAVLSGGIAKFSTTALTVSSHSITASYGGDSNDAAVTSAVVVVTVTAASSGVTLQVSTATLQLGASETFTATLSPATATGTIIFYDGTTALGSVALSGGIAKLSTTALTVGSHSITASYGGDANNGVSVSQIVSVTVTVASSGVSFQASKATLQLGASETLTATVSPATATGSITFMDGTTSLGTVVLSGGTANLSTTALTVGSHSITASYGGDTNDGVSVSQAVTVTVTAASSGVTLQASAATLQVGASETLTATVSPSTAAGSVTFYDGSTAVGTGTLSGGKASFSTSTLAVGVHSITAAYSGDTNDAASTSAAVSVTVNAVSSTVVLSASSNSISSGSSVTLTAIVNPSTATGSVVFHDGTAILGTVTTAAGSATLSVSTLSAGTHSISAAYSGDANNAASLSNSVTVLVVSPVPVISLTASPTTQTQGQPLAFTVALSAVGTGPLPTGTVVFSEGSSVLSSTSLSAGAAVFTTSSMTVGSHTVIATYSGDTNYGATVSSSITVVVIAPSQGDFTVTGPSGEIYISATAPATFSLNLTAQGTFTQAISFSCSMPGVPIICTFSPTTVTFNGDTGTTKVTVNYPANYSLRNNPVRRSDSLAPLLAGTFGIFMLIAFRRSTGKMRLGSLTLLCGLSLSLALGLTGCGSSTGEIHTLTLKATAGNLSHSTTVQMLALTK